MKHNKAQYSQRGRSNIVASVVVINLLNLFPRTNQSLHSLRSLVLIDKRLSVYVSISPPPPRQPANPIPHQSPNNPSPSAVARTAVLTPSSSLPVVVVARRRRRRSSSNQFKFFALCAWEMVNGKCRKCGNYIDCSRSRWR